MEDLAENMKGEINFDILIATPDTMKMVGPLVKNIRTEGLCQIQKLEQLVKM